MKKILFIITFMILTTAACGLSAPPPTPPILDAGFLETAIVSTALIAQNQTQIAIPFPSATFAPTNTPAITETPTFPLYLDFEGPTASCTCENCLCVTSVVITARITIDAQGNITGSLDQYLSHTPPLKFEGTKDKIYGLLEMKNDKASDTKEGKVEFLGSVSNDLVTLECTIQSSGTYYSNGEYFYAKRTALLFRK